MLQVTLQQIAEFKNSIQQIKKGNLYRYNTSRKIMLHHYSIFLNKKKTSQKRKSFIN